MDPLPKIETTAGVSLMSLATIAELARDIYPIISFIAVLCGAILGVHGVYCIIKHRYEKNYHHHNMDGLN